MDETTMGISDKVLDRAFTLEFWDIDVDAWPGWDEARIEVPAKAFIKRILKLLMDALSPARLHFGWRVIGRGGAVHGSCDRGSEPYFPSMTRSTE